MMSARCGRCGDQVIEATDLRCSHADGDEYALVSFRCPTCGISTFVLTTPGRASCYVALGARAFETFPHEIEEPRQGRPISWDDVLDLRNELRELENLERSYGR